MPDTEAIWNTLGSSLHGFIRSRVRDPQVADDLLQDVFVRIHKGIDSLRDEEKVTGWVYSIARNAIVDQARRVTPATVPLGDFPQEEGDSNRAFETDFSTSVKAIIKDLPKTYREVMEMVELEGLTQKEAAARLGLSLSGTKSRVQRGRARIRATLLDCCHIEFDQRGRPMNWEPRSECNRCC